MSRSYSSIALQVGVGGVWVGVGVGGGGVGLGQAGQAPRRRRCLEPECGIIPRSIHAPSQSKIHPDRQPAGQLHRPHHRYGHLPGTPLTPTHSHPLTLNPTHSLPTPRTWCSVPPPRQSAWPCSQHFPPPSPRWRQPAPGARLTRPCPPAPAPPLPSPAVAARPPARKRPPARRGQARGRPNGFDRRPAARARVPAGRSTAAAC